VESWDGIFLVGVLVGVVVDMIDRLGWMEVCQFGWKFNARRCGDDFLSNKKPRHWERL
jgi:hypothetical protein